LATAQVDVGALRKIMVANSLIAAEEAKIEAEREENIFYKSSNPIKKEKKHIDINLGYAAYICLARMEDFGVRARRSLSVCLCERERNTST
jgi:hypothetical protein